MKNIFGKVYPFTTERISQYFPVLDLEDKSVLTVGSSGDQAFNALLCGANKVTIIDISPLTEGFVKLKRDLILDNSRRRLYHKVLDNKEFPLSGDYFSLNDLQKMNIYMSNDQDYDKLRERLSNTEIDFIEGDIFNIDDALEEKVYDRIIFSNILQYVDYYAYEYDYGDTESFISDKFKEWIKHLNKDGILQLAYLYSVTGQNKDLVSICSALYDKMIYLSKFDNDNPNDKAAILYYRK